ncbi:cupin [Pelagivirga sediminicola]|uniref:Cupin n=2 Tax=Pelagivirga sediminicola TaxID=2170575 RepID=A0A2T7GCD8_9RHOB|nr:cupin [Pelagivirga sediminicola]
MRPDDDQAHALVADRLRKLRKANGLSLRQLADAIGTSASFLSQLERGLTGASTSTLIRIADCYGTSISELFDESGVSDRHPIMRKHERPVLQAMHGQKKALLSRRPLTQFETYVAQFQPGGSTGDEPYTHGASSEMLVVLKGAVSLTLDDRQFAMEEGDCAEYQSSVPHRVVNTGADMAEVMFIISPPTSTAKQLQNYGNDGGAQDSETTTDQGSRSNED